MTMPTLGPAFWPGDAYDRASLPERVLLFGTGMLLRALPAAFVDAANREGRFGGRIAVVQSTTGGLAADFAAQDGLFTLVERGAEGGQPVERTRVVGSVSRALVAATAWDAVRDVAASPVLRVIVSNVTEAGFRTGDDEPSAESLGTGGAPASFPAKLADLLLTRWRRTPDAPTLFVVPTELVDDNGPRLRAMVDALTAALPDAADFRDWLDARARFCSSLVDRITTGMPGPAPRAELQARLGYDDALLTVTEPYALWAIEGDPDALREAFPVDAREGAQEGVVFARDIRRYRERKIRLLNGTHTATAPLARLAGVPLVRDAMAHPALGAFIRRVLFQEIAPSVDLPADEVLAFAASVVDRFANPWLEHAWSVIVTNETAKMRLRVAPSLAAYASAPRGVPDGLALAVAAYLRHARCDAPPVDGRGTGSWRGARYEIVDADLATVARHWFGPTGAPARLAADVAASALADPAIWGTSLAGVPGLVNAVARWLDLIERDGVEGALAALPAADPAALPPVLEGMPA